MTTESKKILIDLDLSKRFLSPNPRVKLEAERELKLSSQVCRKPQMFFRYNKLNGQKQTLFLEVGQYFTTYKLLSSLWDCSLKAARYQLAKWEKLKVVKTTPAKDKLGFDLGLIINYNPVFLSQNKGIRQMAKNKGKRGYKNGAGAPISFKNDNRKTTKKVVFFNKDFSKRAFGKLYLLDFSIWEIQKIQDKHSLEEVLDYHRLLKLTKDVSNPKAWLRAALNGKYSLRKVEDYRRSLNLNRMETRKARDEEREYRKQEIERMQAERLRVEEAARKEKEFKAWLRSGDNQARYTEKILEIIQEVEDNKETPATIDTIKNMSFTRTHYRLFQEAYQRRLTARTGKALDRLDLDYQVKLEGLKKLGFGDEFGRELERLTLEKNSKRLEILNLPNGLDLEWKTECIKESGFLRVKLDSWVSKELEKFRDVNSNEVSLDKDVTGFPSVSNHFNSQFVGDR